MSLTQEQADARARGIGGSEAAAVCGLSPWRTPVQVWQEKRGTVKPPDLSNNELIIWGELLEEVIGKEAARRQGWTVHRVRETKVDKEHPYMVANIDFRVVGKREGLEVKNTSQWMSEKWGELGTDDVPEHYLMQGVHYMRVMDYDAWNYAVLLGGNELLNYRVERDSDIERRLIKLEGQFWECVEEGRHPPPIKVDDLTRIWAKTVGRKVATPEIMDAVMRAKAIKAQMKPLDTELEEIKLKVGTFMADAGDLFDPAIIEAPICTYRANPETRVDTEGVRKKLKPKIVELIELASSLRTKSECVALSTLDIAMLEQQGPAAFADLLVASMLKTGTVRKFLPK